MMPWCLLSLAAAALFGTPLPRSSLLLCWSDYESLLFLIFKDDNDSKIMLLVGVDTVLRLCRQDTVFFPPMRFFGTDSNGKINTRE
jgi:hypothetical protein